MLLQQGCDVNSRSSDGMTPLSIAAFWGYADIAKLLLEHRFVLQASFLSEQSL